MKQHATIHEKHLKTEVEVHRQPMVREIDHAPIVHRSEQVKREENKEVQPNIPEIVARELKQEKSVVVTKLPTTVDVEHNVKRVIVNQPIVHEIHHQPIIEEREEIIERVIHEAPSVRVITEKPILIKQTMDEPYHAKGAELEKKKAIIAEAQQQIENPPKSDVDVFSTESAGYMLVAGALALVVGLFVVDYVRRS